MQFSIKKRLRRIALVAGLVGSFTSLAAPDASAVEGTEVSATTGIWAPMLPEFQSPNGTTSGDSVGGIIGLRGHHRFDGYLTNIEGNINYGRTGEAEMFGFDALLRDTWSFGIGDLSAGAGYSQMNWNHEYRGSDIDSDFVGGKIVAGWETAFGNRPVWLDIAVGIYDMDGKYRGDGGGAAEINETAMTYGFDIRTDCTMFNIPARAVFGLDYISDITTWQGGAIGTDDAVVLTGGLELRLF